MDTKELGLYEKQISVLEGQATEVVIETMEEYLATVDMSAKLEEIGSKIKAQKESITKPANETLKNTRKLFKPVEDKIENAQAILNKKILAYNKKVNEAAVVQENKIADRVERGTLKEETAEKKIDAIARVGKTTQGNMGSVQIKKVMKVRIPELDAIEALEAEVEKKNLVKEEADKLIREGTFAIRLKGELPREYLKPDEVAIRRDALGGKEIPGAEVYPDDVVSNIKNK